MKSETKKELGCYFLNASLLILGTVVLGCFLEDEPDYIFRLPLGMAATVVTAAIGVILINNSLKK
jgi:hypothetical protein